MLLMGYTGSSKIEGRGSVVLKMPLGGELTLKNVKHVPDMQKNLISGIVLCKAGFAVNFESDILFSRRIECTLVRVMRKGTSQDECSDHFFIKYCNR